MRRTLPAQDSPCAGKGLIFRQKGDFFRQKGDYILILCSKNCAMIGNRQAHIPHSLQDLPLRYFTCCVGSDLLQLRQALSALQGIVDDEVRQIGMASMDEKRRVPSPHQKNAL